MITHTHTHIYIYIVVREFITICVSSEFLIIYENHENKRLSYDILFKILNRLNTGVKRCVIVPRYYMHSDIFSMFNHLPHSRVLPLVEVLNLLRTSPYIDRSPKLFKIYISWILLVLVPIYYSAVKMIM